MTSLFLWNYLHSVGERSSTNEDKYFKMNPLLILNLVLGLSIMFMLIWAVLYLFYWNGDESEEWTEKYIYVVSYSSRNNNATREKFQRHKIILNSKRDKSGKIGRIYTFCVFVVQLAIWYFFSNPIVANMDFQKNLISCQKY